MNFLPYRSSHFRHLVLTAISILSIGFPFAVFALDSVTLQLKWSHAFQFAGYYAAQEKGYYRDVGLDVSFLEAHPGDSPVQAVMEGKAEYGVASSSLLLARKAGAPVVVLASIFQHSALVLIAPQLRPSQGVHDLLGKRVMLDSQGDELLAYLKQEGIPPDRITRVEHSLNTQDLIDGKVDAMAAYITNEPYFLDRAGFSYQVYTPRSVGIDFYGDNLFTTEQELKLHPARAKAFREASLRGWNYAMDHPEEIVDLILAKYPNQNTRDYYLFEARQMVPMLRSDIIEIGYINPGRWRHIADTYADLDLLPHGFSLDGFLYQPDAERDLRWLYLAGSLLLLVSAIAFYIYRNNQRLAEALEVSNTTKELLRVSEERHRLLADNAMDVIWMMGLDRRFTYVSPSVEKLRGYTSSEVMQQSLEQVFAEASVAVAAAVLDQALAAISSGQSFAEYRGELEQPCKDGSTVWTDVTISPMQNMDGEFIGILGVSRDITERKLADLRIRESEQRFRDIAEVSADWIWEIDAEGRYIYASDSVETMMGYRPDEVLGRTVFDFMSAEEGQSVAPAFGRIVTGKEPFSDLEITVLAKDGTAHITLVSATPIIGKNGELLGYRGVARDITERMRLEGEIRKLAFHDALTGLPNRRLLTDRLTQTMAASKRNGCSGALLFLDMDNFKPLNDTHGHEVGDLLLVEVADRLRRCVRESDTIARFGGDEFVVILNELAADGALSTLQAATVANKIRSCLSEPYVLIVKRDGLSDVTVEHHCAASIGVALFVGEDEDPDDVLKRADGAMYAAKASGRNAVRFAPDILRRAEAALNLEADFAPLAWSADFESGNALIDTQHRALFERINELLKAILAVSPAEEVAVLIDRLLQLANQHFHDEEAIISAAGFPEVASHALLHRDFLQSAEEMRRRFHNGALPLAELFRLLTKDVVQHIAVADRQFYSFLSQSQSQSQSPARGSATY